MKLQVDARAGDEEGELASLEDEPGIRPNAGFSRFFDQEWPRLRRYLRRFVSAPEADDLAQEAFARVWADGQAKQSASGFLYRTARNLLIDDRRRARRVRGVMVEGDCEAVPDPHPSPEEEVHWRMRLERAAALFDRMTPKCRQVFMLRAIEGCSYAEIASRTGLSLIAVEKQLLRAFEICADWREHEQGRKKQRRRGA